LRGFLGRPRWLGASTSSASTAVCCPLLPERRRQGRRPICTCLRLQIEIDQCLSRYTPLVGGAESTSPSEIHRLGGQKFPLLLKAGHTATVQVVGSARTFAGLGYVPRSYGGRTLRDSNQTITFVSCRTNETSGRVRMGRRSRSGPVSRLPPSRCACHSTSTSTDSPRRDARPCLSALAATDQVDITLPNATRSSRAAAMSSASSFIAHHAKKRAVAHSHPTWEALPSFDTTALAQRLGAGVDWQMQASAAEVKSPTSRRA
jgi:hypothetical protein